MPRGVYPRRVGRTASIKGAVLSLLGEGWSQRQVAKIFGISEYSVKRLRLGDWNPGRRKGRDMRKTEVYCTTCSKCGREILTERREGECAGCGGMFRIEFPGTLQGHSRPSSISEEEDLR